MTTRLIYVLHDNLVIGSVTLEPWDPSMGIAGGFFIPNQSHRPAEHASEYESVYPTDDERTPLRVLAADGTDLSTADVYLMDWSESAGETYGRELAVSGIYVHVLFGLGLG